VVDKNKKLQEEFREFFKKNDIPVDLEMKPGKAALHYMTQMGCPRFVRILLELGADVTRYSNDNHPLIIAAEEGFVTVFKILAKKKYNKVIIDEVRDIVEKSEDPDLEAVFHRYCEKQERVYRDPRPLEVLTDDSDEDLKKDETKSEKQTKKKKKYKKSPKSSDDDMDDDEEDTFRPRREKSLDSETTDTESDGEIGLLVLTEQEKLQIDQQVDEFVTSKLQEGNVEIDQIDKLEGKMKAIFTKQAINRKRITARTRRNETKEKAEKVKQKTEDEKTAKREAAKQKRKDEQKAKEDLATKHAARKKARFEERKDRKQKMKEIDTFLKGLVDFLKFHRFAATKRQEKLRKKQQQLVHRLELLKGSLQKLRQGGPEDEDEQSYNQVIELLQVL